MVNFYSENPPKKKKFYHLHGYHGSSKDCCLYCGSSDSENVLCEERIEEDFKEQEKKLRRNQLRNKLLQNIKKVITKSEFEMLKTMLGKEERV